MSNDYIFKKDNNKIKFVGDFEGLYQNETDPWGQSGQDKRLQELYKSSRTALLENIQQLPKVKSACEVGCGLGYVTNFLEQHLEDIVVDGIDISNTAIQKAKSLFNQNYLVGDITDKNLNLPQQYDIIILNQILWYILEDLPTVFKNVNQFTTKNGYLIISTLFLKNQQYGNEIIGSFDELIQYCLNNSYRFIHGNIDYNDNLEHWDSILVLQKN